MEEREFVRKLKAKDEGAYRELIKKFGSKMFRLIFHLTKNREETEEIMQEVFLKILRNIQNFREESLFSTWLFRITVNTALSYIKKKKRRGRERLLSELKREEGEKIDLEDREAEKTEERVEEEERKKMVRKALESLPPAYRIALILKDIEGMPVQQVAEVLGLTEGGAKVKIHRGRLLLKKALQEAVERGAI